jgi:hypothetical protein
LNKAQSDVQPKPLINQLNPQIFSGGGWKMAEKWIGKSMKVKFRIQLSISMKKGG